MPAGVHCGVLFRVKGAARSLHTLGFSSAFPKREAPSAAPSHDGLTTTPSSARSCSTTTSLRQATGCVSPDRMASRADRFWLCSTRPGHFGPDEHTRRPRQRLSSCSTTAQLETSDRLCLPDHLASHAERSSLCSPKPDHFGPVCAQPFGSLRHFAQKVGSSRLDSHLESQQHSVGGPGARRDSSHTIRPHLRD